MKHNDLYRLTILINQILVKFVSIGGYAVDTYDSFLESSQVQLGLFSSVYLKR